MTGVPLVSNEWVAPVLERVSATSSLSEASEVARATSNDEGPVVRHRFAGRWGRSPCGWSPSHRDLPARAPTTRRAIATERRARSTARTASALDTST